MKHNPCDDHGHQYRIIPGESYCKVENGKDDTSIWYHTLFCAGCGDTLEVVAQDRRKVEHVKVKVVSGDTNEREG